jgi:uncharacterized membrane protein (UPF0127 family)
MFLINARTHKPVSSAVEMATTRTERRRGLLGRDNLDASSALVLSPCAAVHTAFMRFGIDVVFVDTEWRVLKMVGDLRPWRAAVCFGAHATIELPAGRLRAGDVAVGDRVYLASSRAIVAPRCADGSSQNSSTSGSLSSVA